MMTEGLKLTLLDNGDIEVIDKDGNTVYHKTYNPLESVKNNLCAAYDWMVAYRKPGFDREAYEEEQRQRIRFEKRMAFAQYVKAILRKQKGDNNPIYAIVEWDCLSFAGIEAVTIEGDKDLLELKKLFREKYSNLGFGITELSYSIVKIELTKIDSSYTACRSEWKEAFRLHLEKIYEKKGPDEGAYCCGYHWCCDICKGDIQLGCADCVQTIHQILLDNKVQIDYLDYDFQKWEEKAKEIQLKIWNTKK